LIKIPNRLGKNFRKPKGGIFLTHTVHIVDISLYYKQNKARVFIHFKAA